MGNGSESHNWRAIWLTFLVLMTKGAARIESLDQLVATDAGCPALMPRATEQLRSRGLEHAPDRPLISWARTRNSRRYSRRRHLTQRILHRTVRAYGVGRSPRCWAVRSRPLSRVLLVIGVGAVPAESVDDPFRDRSLVAKGVQLLRDNTFAPVIRAARGRSRVAPPEGP